MRKILHDNRGIMAYIQMGIVILIMSALAVPIFFTFIASIPSKTIDASLRSAIGVTKFNTNITSNTTVSILNIGGTVLSLNPLSALVAVAAGMISLLAGAFLATGRPGI